MIITDQFSTHIKNKMPIIQFLEFTCEIGYYFDGSIDNSDNSEYESDPLYIPRHVFVELSAIETLKHVHFTSFGYDIIGDDFYYGKYVKKVNGDPKLQMLDNDVGLIAFE